MYCIVGDEAYLFDPKVVGHSGTQCFSLGSEATKDLRFFRVGRPSSGRINGVNGLRMEVTEVPGIVGELVTVHKIEINASELGVSLRAGQKGKG